MTEIKLRAGEARDMASHVRQEASAATDQMNNLRSRLNSLTDSFTGQSQMAFDEAFTNWKNGADQMLEGLDGLGKFLTAAADTIEETDQTIASQLRGA